jgi:hypothetical protein
VGLGDLRERVRVHQPGRERAGVDGGAELGEPVPIGLDMITVTVTAEEQALAS